MVASYDLCSMMGASRSPGCGGWERVMGSNVRGEPAGITVADVMILVVGVAAGFAVEPVRAETSRVVQVCGFAAPVTTYTSAFWTLAPFALPVELGLALAVFV